MFYIYGVVKIYLFTKNAFKVKIISNINLLIVNKLIFNDYI